MQKYTHKTIFTNDMPCNYYVYIIKHKIILIPSGLSRGEKSSYDGNRLRY